LALPLPLSLPLPLPLALSLPLTLPLLALSLPLLTLSLPLLALSLPLLTLTLALLGLTLPLALPLLAACALLEALKSDHLPFAALPLLTEHFAQFLELLAKLLFLLLAHLFTSHSVQVFCPLVEVIGGESKLLSDVFGGLLEFAVESIELALGRGLLVLIAL
jgi:hypothetical protein